MNPPLLRASSILLLTLLLLAGIPETQAQSAQWRGPERNGIYPDKGLLKQWPEEGPDLLFRKDSLGNGYSSPVYYEGNIYISGRRDSLDVLTKLSMDGTALWETAYGSAWMNSFPETRSTPTIEDGRIYIMGGLGNVVCMDTDEGKILWEHNTHQEFKGEFHRWGMTESLLLTEGAVISSPTGNETAVVALDKKDGSLIWKSEARGGVRAYASPLMISHKGREILLILSSNDLLAVNPSDGAILWSFDLLTYAGERGRRNNTNTPLYHNGEIFVSSGYDAESVMLSLLDDGSAVELKWHNGDLDVHHGGMVLLDGYIYGSNWINNGKGNWVCQEWESGDVMYEEKWNNKGSIIYADSLLYIFDEKQGNIGLLEPSPEGFNLISSFKLESKAGPYWAHMTIYDQKLFVRHGTILYVYDLKSGE